MASCPKCGEKIPPYDWSSKCKKCGVDMLTYGMEQRLDADEAKAEAEFRRFNNFLKKLGPLGRKFAKDDNE